MVETFEWQGATFTVRAQTVFDRDMYNAIVVQHGGTITADKGFDWNDDTVAIPPILDKMMAKYFRWMQVTTIQGDALDNINFLTANGGVTAHYDTFAELIGNNPDLASEWQATYDRANKKPVDETEEKKETLGKK